MKTIKRDNKKLVFQGDIMIQKVAELPEDAKDANTDIVAHSETGHHHVVTSARVFSVPDGEVLYMQALGKEIELEHQRSWDTHEPIKFETNPGDIFKIRRQREWSPDGWRRVQD